MMSESQVFAEAESVIEVELTQNRVVSKPWLIGRILSRWPDEDAGRVGRIVDRCFRNRSGTERDGKPLTPRELLEHAAELRQFIRDRLKG